jgi:hypothetical protein
MGRSTKPQSVSMSRRSSFWTAGFGDRPVSLSRTMSSLLKLTDLVRDAGWRKGKAVFLADTCCV